MPSSVFTRPYTMGVSFGDAMFPQQPPVQRYLFFFFLHLFYDHLSVRRQGAQLCV